MGQQQQQHHQLQQERIEHQSSQRYADQDMQSRSLASIQMMSPEDIRSNLNAKLDRENKVVVEILTEEEYSGLEQCWPEIHSSYTLKFAILNNGNAGMEVVWTTSPCHACDATGYHSNHDFTIRNRSRNWVNSSNQKKPSF